MAKVKPHTARDWKCQQSRFPEAPELPTRMIVVAPSGGGKTTLLVSLALDIYRGCFSRIYVFSPSVHLDDHWKAVKDYCRDALHVEEPELSQCFHDKFDEGALRRIIARQTAVVKLAKERGLPKIFQVLVYVDDFADSPAVCRGSQTLHQLFIRGRHSFISTFLSVQRYKILHPVLRVNATDLIVFKLRSLLEMDAIVDENSAAFGKDATEALLKAATTEPYSFLWLNARAKDFRELFWLRFEHPMQPSAELMTHRRRSSRRKAATDPDTDEPDEPPADAPPPRSRGRAPAASG